MQSLALCLCGVYRQWQSYYRFEFEYEQQSRSESEEIFCFVSVLSFRCHNGSKQLPNWKLKKKKRRTNTLVRNGCSLHSPSDFQSQLSQFRGMGSCFFNVLIHYSPCCLLFLLKKENGISDTVENVRCARIGTNTSDADLIRCEILVFSILCIVPFHLGCAVSGFWCAKNNFKKIPSTREMQLDRWLNAWLTSASGHPLFVWTQREMPKINYKIYWKAQCGIL